MKSSGKTDIEKGGTKCQDNQNIKILDSLESWMRNSMQNFKYGEIGITMTLHQGKIVRISKMIAEMGKED